MRRVIPLVMVVLAAALAAQEAKPTYEGSPDEAIKFERAKEAAARAQEKKETQKQTQEASKKQKAQRSNSARNRPLERR